MRKKALLLVAIGWTLLVVLLCLVSFSDFPKVGVESADKFVHVFFHFVFTILWVLYFQLRNPDVDTFRITSKIVFWSVVFGVVIEMAQELLTTTRKADFYDIAANFAGAFAAAVALIIYHRMVKKIT